MDVRTLFVTIGLGYGILAVLLLASGRPRRGTPEAFLAVSYTLGSLGVLLQSTREVLPVAVVLIGGSLLAWMALQWQAWAAFALAGAGVGTRFRVTLAALTVLVAVATVALPPVPRTVLANLIYASLFALTALPLLTWHHAPSALRNVTVGILAVLAAMYGARAVAIAAGAMATSPLTDGARTVDRVYFTIVFAALISSAFGLLLLGKRVAEMSLQDSLTQTETILGTLTTGVAIVTSGRLARVNPALAAMLGYAPTDLVGRSADVLFPTEQDHQRWQRAMESSFLREGRHTTEVQMAGRTGEPRWTWAQAAPLDWRDGHRRVVVSVTDISDLKAMQAELTVRASVDDLTGLLNRRSFLERAPLELSRSDRTGCPVCIAVIDLDRLKDINDVHGRLAGDHALAAFAHACRRALRDVDVIARLGGDEFAVVLPDATLTEGQAAMERLLEELRRAPIDLNGTAVPLDASVGVAEYEPPEPLDAILARADRAMYKAKAGGRGAIVAQDSL